MLGPQQTAGVAAGFRLWLMAALPARSWQMQALVTTFSSTSAAGTSPRNAWSYDAGFNAAYQVDLFGRVRRTIEAAHANADQVLAAEDAVRVTVAAQTASAYASLCGYAQQAEVARALNLLGVTPRDMVAIFQALKEAGALQCELTVI